MVSPPRSHRCHGRRAAGDGYGRARPGDVMNVPCRRPPWGIRGFTGSTGSGNHLPGPSFRPYGRARSPQDQGRRSRPRRRARRPSGRVATCDRGAGDPPAFAVDLPLLSSAAAVPLPLTAAQGAGRIETACRGDMDRAGAGGVRWRPPRRSMRRPDRPLSISSAPVSPLAPGLPVSLLDPFLQGGTSADNFHMVELPKFTSSCRS